MSPLAVRLSTVPATPTQQRSMWARLLDAVSGVPSPDHLVSVALLTRREAAHAQGTLSEAGLTSVVHRAGGTGPYDVLVPARQSRRAADVLASV